MYQRQGDRLVRGFEAAARLNTMQSLEGALRLANHMRAGPLAERIGQLLEARMAEEADLTGGGDHVSMEEQGVAVGEQVGGQGVAVGEQEEQGAEGTMHTWEGKENEQSVMGSLRPASKVEGGKSRWVDVHDECVGIDSFTRVVFLHSEGAKRKQPSGSANPFARKIKAPKT